MNSFLSINDLKHADVLKIFDLAKKMKKNPKRYQSSLQGEKIGLIFEKPSTRTWVSFDAGVSALGGGIIYLGPQDISLGVREEIRDVARVLNRYLGGVVMRTFSHNTIVQFEKYYNRPVINGLSDWEHPCQAMADFFTLQEKFPKKKKIQLTYIGDGNNVLHSLLLLGAKMGAAVHYATPKNHEPSVKILRQVKKEAKKTGASIQGFYDPVAAVKNADAVYTDVWVSMGEEKMRKQKIKSFKNMQVNSQLLRHAQRHAVVMHCLPAHRGEEITDSVLEGKRSIVFDQAENRLHLQKAILHYLFS